MPITFCSLEGRGTAGAKRAAISTNAFLFPPYFDHARLIQGHFVCIRALLAAQTLSAVFSTDRLADFYMCCMHNARLAISLPALLHQVIDVLLSPASEKALSESLFSLLGLTWSFFFCFYLRMEGTEQDLLLPVQRKGKAVGCKNNGLCYGFRNVCKWESRECDVLCLTVTLAFPRAPEMRTGRLQDMWIWQMEPLSSFLSLRVCLQSPWEIHQCLGRRLENTLLAQDCVCVCVCVSGCKNWRTDFLLPEHSIHKYSTHKDNFNITF